jgi:hypothetical protein
MEEAKMLLKEAHEILKDQYFIIEEDDETNNEKVIELDEKIIKFLGEN